MLISIIIPIYNSEKYINKCLDSLINQTYTNIEIICVNDGSTDNSYKILEEYQKKDNRIKIINQENQGVSIARNKAIDNVSGTYLLFVDSDDWLDKYAIEKLTNFVKNKDTDIVYFNYFGVNQNIYRKYDSISRIKENNKLNLLYNSFSALWNKMYKVSFLNKNQIRFVPQVAYAEDTIFWLTILSSEYKLEFFKEYLYFYREDNNNSVTKNWEKFLKQHISSYNIFRNTVYFENMTNDEKLIITDCWSKLVFSIWSNLKQPKYQKDYDKLIENFLENYKQFKYKDYKHLTGYKRIKNKYWIKFLKSIRDLYFLIIYRRF